jgi:hypothetical protein
MIGQAIKKAQVSVYRLRWLAPASIEDCNRRSDPRRLLVRHPKASARSASTNRSRGLVRIAATRSAAWFGTTRAGGGTCELLRTVRQRAAAFRASSAGYPLWSKDLGAVPTPEEIEEIVLAAAPVALTQLFTAIPKAPALKRLRRDQNITVSYHVFRRRHHRARSRGSGRRETLPPLSFLNRGRDRSHAVRHMV